jgi:hypothetical protein
MLFLILALVIGVFAAITLQDANAASKDDNSCRQYHPSDTSKKCSQNDRPFILPFP